MGEEYGINISTQERLIYLITCAGSVLQCDYSVIRIEKMGINMKEHSSMGINMKEHSSMDNFMALVCHKSLFMQNEPYLFYFYSDSPYIKRFERNVRMETW